MKSHLAKRVEQAAKGHVANGFWVWSAPKYQAQVRQLLKREHAAVVRKVKAMKSDITDDPFHDGFNAALFRLFVWLEKRAR